MNYKKNKAKCLIAQVKTLKKRTKNKVKSYVLVNALYKNGFGSDEMLMSSDMAEVLGCSISVIDATLKSAMYKLKKFSKDSDLFDYLMYIEGKHYELN